MYCSIKLTSRPTATCSTSEDVCNLDSVMCSTIYSEKLSSARPIWETNGSDEMCQLDNDFLVDGSVKTSSPLLFDQFNKVLFYATAYISYCSCACFKTMDFDTFSGFYLFYLTSFLVDLFYLTFFLVDLFYLTLKIASLNLPEGERFTFFVGDFYMKNRTLHLFTQSYLLL